MASKPNKVIITCAVTGAIHTPTMSEHLPLTPAQIAEQAIAAAEAGAAILHLHARDPVDGRPSADPELFAQFLGPIKAATNAVINITSQVYQPRTEDSAVRWRLVSWNNVDDHVVNIVQPSAVYQFIDHLPEVEKLQRT